MTKAIIFQCDEDLKETASQKLQDCGISMSEYLRTCLQAFVNSDNLIKKEIEKVVNIAVTTTQQ